MQNFLSPLLILMLLFSLFFCSSAYANADRVEAGNPVFHLKEGGAWKKIQLPSLAVDEHLRQHLENGRMAAEKDATQSDAIQKEIHHLVAMHDFQGLEKAAQHYRTAEPFFSSGAMTIDRFYESIVDFYTDTDATNPFRNEKYEGVRPLEFFIAQWKKAFPHSDTAQMAWVNYCYLYGWKIRGEGYLQTVGEQEVKSFLEYTLKAKAALKMVEHPRALPEYYETQVLLWSGWPSDNSLQHILLEGRRYYPKHWPLHRDVARFLLYRWYGQPGDMTHYAKWAATRSKTPYAPLVMYARIANTISGLVVNDPDGGVSEFLSYGFSWPHVRAGYLLLAKEGLLYPARFRSFLWMAVLYRDRETAKTLFQQAPEADCNAWSNQEMLFKAKQWANGLGEYPYPMPHSQDSTYS